MNGTLRRHLLAFAAVWLLGGQGAWAAPSGADPQPGPPCPPAVAMPTAAELAAGRAQARDRGFLWRLSKDGHSSFLFGTIHIGKLAWAFQGPIVERAIRRSEVLALELDLTDAATLATLQQVTQAPGRPPPPVLPIDLEARLVRQREAACVPAVPFTAFHPVMQAVALATLAARWDGLDPAYGQEFILAGMARALGRPVVALERPETQLAALVPAQPAEAVAKVAGLLEQLEQDQVRPLLRRLAAAWEGGDLATIETYAQWCDCLHTPEDRAGQARLNDARNPALADGIDGLHRQGRRVFAAIGALHMTGERALPLLMAERGYRVERIPLGP